MDPKPVINMSSQINNKKPLVLLVYASTGSGHKTAAVSVADALKKIVKTGGLDNNFNNAQIKTVDVLDFCLKKIDGNNAVKAYSNTLPGLFDFTWRNNFTGRILWGGGAAWPNILFKKFENYLKENKPSVVVCTHMMGANIAAKARINLKQNFPIISIPTDYETEGLWPHKETDLFCVASQSMIETLEARKVPNGKMICTGIPVSPDFAIPHDKKACRDMLNLPQDKTIAVVLAGASEANPYVNLRKSLDHIIEYFGLMDWMHFVICTGKDRAYRRNLLEQCKQHKAKNITVLGYTKKMPQILAASDVALGKSGGLSITECLCAKVPNILIGKAYAQERVNQRFMTRIGAAFQAVGYKEIIDVLCHITTNEVVYNALLQNMETVRKPEAAQTIAKAALQMAGCTNIEGYTEQALRLYHKRPHKQFSPGIYIGKKPVRIR